MSYIEELAKRDAPVLMALNEDQLYVELARVAESLSETPQAEKRGYVELKVQASLEVEAKVVPFGEESRLKAFGQRLFNRMQRQAYELICSSEAESVEQRESLLQSFGIKNETALIACFTSVLVSYLGMATPVAVVIATLLVKTLFKTVHETLCETWEAALRRIPPVPTATNDEICP